MTQPAIDPTLAAWESAHLLNLGPHLTESQSETLWEAMLALRVSRNATAFAATVRDLAAEVAPRARVLLDDAIANLPTVAAPAQES